MRRFGAGFGAGLVVGGAIVAVVAGVSTPEPPAVRAPAPRWPAPQTVCATVTPRAEVADPEGEALRLRWCEARLAEKTRETATARRPWPETLAGPDEPLTWTAAMDAALAACAPALTPAITDCEEVPCVTALRPAPGTDVTAATKDLNTCLSEKLPDPLGGTAGALVVRARCPDGTEEPVVIVSALTDEALDAVAGVDRESFLGATFALYMVLGRRTESALQLWECGHRETHGPPRVGTP